MTTYYVSNAGSDAANGTTEATPWATLLRVRTALQDGTITTSDEVLFKRGNEFFGSFHVAPTHASFNATSGVRLRIGAYGAGNRPKISGYKILNASGGWANNGSGVWKIDLTDVGATAGAYTGRTDTIAANTGFLKVNGTIKGVKKFALVDLAQPWDFMSDDTYLYVKASANPTTLATDIRAAVKTDAIAGKNCMEFTNLDIFGFGGNGYNGSGKNVRIMGCAIHEIGGSSGDGVSTTRYGNGIQAWIGSVDALFYHNDIYDVYDTATTMQGGSTPTYPEWNNVHFRYNRIWNCNQSFEVWCDPKDGYTGTGFVNTSFRYNICINAGYSWGDPVRPDTDGKATHLLIYGMNLPIDINVSDNVFLSAKENYLYCAASTNGGVPPAGYVMSKNLVLLAPGTKISYTDTQTVESHAAWISASGKDSDSQFIILPANPTSVPDALALAEGFAAFNTAQSKVLHHALNEARAGLLALQSTVKALPVPVAGMTPFRAGYYYSPLSTGSTTNTSAEATLRGIPVVPAISTVINAVAFEVTTAGSAGALVRVGVYRTATNGIDLELVVDGGTVDATTTGTKTKSISAPVKGGEIIWLVAVPQGAATTAPVLRCVQNTTPVYLGSTDANLMMQNQLSGIQVTGVTGALPATITAPGPTTAAHKMLAKATG